MHDEEEAPLQVDDRATDTLSGWSKKAGGGQFGGMSFVDFVTKNPGEATPELPPPPPPEPMSKLLATYKQLVAQENAANAKRMKLVNAHLAAANAARASAEAVEVATEALQAAILTPGEAAARKALNTARAELADLTERVSLIATAIQALPDENYAMQIQTALNAILERAGYEELGRVPPLALEVLNGSFAALAQGGCNWDWPDFLAWVFPQEVEREGIAAAVEAVLKRQGVSL